MTQNSFCWGLFTAPSCILNTLVKLAENLCPTLLFGCELCAIWTPTVNEFLEKEPTAAIRAFRHDDRLAFLLNIRSEQLFSQRLMALIVKKALYSFSK